MGDQGACICLRCGRREPHERAVPCRTRKCPHCGAAMLREGSEHHRAYLRKRADRDRALGRDPATIDHKAGG